MSNEKRSSDLNHSPTLTDRVKGRVTQVGLALDHSGNGAAAPVRRARSRAAKAPARPLGNSEAEREARSLRRVYGELKTTYQQYRKRTGRPAVPELRDAVHAFKQGPSLTSLVAVAAFLDDRGLLGW